MTAALSLSLVGVIAVGGTLAYFTDKSDVRTNTFVSGNVNISLTDETHNGEGGKAGTPAEDGSGVEYTNVQPGDTLNKHVSVTVLGAAEGRPASSNAHVGILVRAASQKSAPSTTELYDLVDEAVDRQEDVDGDIWADRIAITDDAGALTGYLYVYNESGYEDGVPAGTELDLFNDIKIPTAWDNAYASSSFSISVEAYAIQAENVDYDQFEAAVKGELTDSNGDTVEFQQVED